MSDRKRSTQLIQNYLDQIAAESELAELQRLIVDSPKAASDFANAVRLEAALADHFGGKRRMIDLSEILDCETEVGISAVSKVCPRVAITPARTWVAAAAVLLIASVAIVFWLSVRGDRSSMRDSSDYSVVSGRILVDGIASDAIRPGARLSVRGSAAAVIEMPDKSRTQLEPDSELVVHGPVGDARQTVEFIRGEGRFRISEGRGLFCVETPVGLISVLGTEFTVNLRSEENSLAGAPDMKLRLAQILTVAVMFGTVEVDVDGEKYVLFEGESRVFAAERGREDREERGKRYGRPHFYGKYQAYDASQKTLFVNYFREGRGELKATFDVDSNAEIIVDAKTGKLSDIAEGASMRIWFSDKTRKRIGGLEVEGQAVGGRGGRRIQSVDISKSTVTLRMGERPENVKTYKVAKDAQIIIKGDPGKLSDLAVGEIAWMRLSAMKSVNGKTLSYIRQGHRKRDREIKGEKDGDRRSREKTDKKHKEGEGKGAGKRSGHPQFYAKYKSYDSSQKTMFVKYFREGRGELQATWDIDRDAEIIVDGRPGKISDLGEGCSLKAWFSGNTRKRVKALEAEGPSIGHRRWGQRVSSVDAAKSTITLRMGKHPDAIKTYPVAKNASITIKGKPGKLSDVSTTESAWIRMSADMKTIAYIKQGSARREE